MKAFDNDGRFERFIFLNAESGIHGGLGDGGGSEDLDAESLVFAQRPLGISHHQSRVGNGDNLINDKLQAWMGKNGREVQGKD